MYEKEHQCLAAGVTCRYPANAIVWLLIAKAALHGRRAQCPNDSSCCADTCIFILWLGTFADEAGRDTVFGAVSSVLVVGIDGVSTDSGDFRASQFLLILYAFLKSDTLVERFEGMVFDEGYSINLYVVDLGPEFHALVLLASDDRTDLGAGRCWQCGALPLVCEPVRFAGGTLL